MQIERLSAKDYEEAMDLMNMVFSMAHCPFNFADFLPRLYKPTDEHMRNNLVVRENNKIRALVGLYPDTVQVGDTMLKLGGIGAVSSHPNDRGKGWMKLLMNQQVEVLKQEGYDLSFLIGQRQRYMYFGYEKAGIMLEYRLNKSNFKHSPEFKTLPQFTLEPLQASDAKRIAAAKALHDRQLVHCVRSQEDFYWYLKTSHMRPWTAIDPEGKLTGYLVSNPENTRITELFADNETALAGMVQTWFAQQSVRETTVILPVWTQESVRWLSGLAEDVKVTDSGNWNIVNWEKVVGALLRAKNAQRHLANGTICIGIRGYGNLALGVHGAAVSCALTVGKADMEWDALTATRILFGHTPAPLIAAVPFAFEPLVSSWFPLPLGWLPQNYV